MDEHEHRDDPLRHQCRRSSVKWQAVPSPVLANAGSVCGPGDCSGSRWNRWTGRPAFSRARSPRGAAGSRPPIASPASSRPAMARYKGASIDPPGYDAGKKIKGKKRHILVDTTGLMMHGIVHAADIQDRDGGGLVMATLFGLYPFLLKLFADGGYQGPVFQAATRKAYATLNVEIFKRSDQAKGFTVLPRRWVVERTFAWFGR